MAEKSISDMNTFEKFRSGYWDLSFLSDENRAFVASLIVSAMNDGYLVAKHDLKAPINRLLERHSQEIQELIDNENG